MNCSHPYKGFACGKCLNCRIQYATMWSDRLWHTQNGQDSVFVTLTYDDEHLPADCLLHKEDLQNFFKRLRKKLAFKIKYYAYGEYGNLSNSSVALARPHFHAIIIGLPCNPKVQSLIESVWKNGFVEIGNVTVQSCRYVTDYVMKKRFEKNDKTGRLIPVENNPFRLCSNGLGKEFVLDNLDQIVANCRYYSLGSARKLPRYYQDKVYNTLLSQGRVRDALEFKLHCREIALESANENALRFVRSHWQQELDTLADIQKKEALQKEKHQETLYLRRNCER